MGIVRTDQWLKDDFYFPEKVCENLTSVFPSLTPKGIYDVLQQLGMYRPNRQTESLFKEMMDEEIWGKLSVIERKYKRKWQGPEVPIYVFPGRNLPFERKFKKNGFTFPDKIFLFLDDAQNTNMCEALFVHEYHHIARLSKINKNLQDYTLLDSLLMEGLAEQAVREYCGEEYVDHFVRKYHPMDLLKYWRRYYLHQLDIKITNPNHDRFLFGSQFGKPKLGYAIGYAIVESYRERNPFVIGDTLIKQAKYFLTEPWEEKK